MTSSSGSRPPIDAASATPSGGRWRVEVVARSGSTNADVAERFRRGDADDGLVLVAEDQTAGRGRLGREWVTPPGASLTVSFLLVPEDAPAERWPWLPLLTGVAAADAVRRVGGTEVALKWPNDVLVEDRKLGGILLERVERDREGRGEAAAVIGIGLNCTQSREELPVPDATSLALEGAADVDRSALLRALVEELDRRLAQWAGGDAEGLRSAYLALCGTPGREVRVAVPGGEVTGTATDVDPDGRLVVRTAAGEEHLGAGDVVHVRPAAR